MLFEPLDLPDAPPLFADFEAVLPLDELPLFDDFEADLLSLSLLLVDFDAPPLPDLPDAEAAPLVVFEEDAFALFADFSPPVDFDEAAFAPDVFDAPPDLAFDAPPDFAPDDFLPPLVSLSSRSPTASAATFRAVSAAPVAAPIRISPATSFAVSKTGEDFFDDDFDFAESALFVELALLADDFDFEGVDAFDVVF